MPNGGVRYNPGSLLEGMNVTYFCEKGYTLVGTSVQTCLSDGTLSGDLPSCGEQQLKYVSIKNHATQENYNIAQH